MREFRRLSLAVPPPFLALLALLGLLILPTPARAVSFEQAFERLRKVHDDFVNTGTVCEHVARMELEERYPPSRYQIDIGVSYLAGDQVVGELDVLVLEKSSGRVPVIGEVKCWRDLRAGLDKAHEQRERFLQALEQGRKDPKLEVQFVRFTGSESETTPYEAKQFLPLPEHISVAQKGGRALGYDVELEMSLEQLMELRKKLLALGNPRR